MNKVNKKISFILLISLSGVIIFSAQNSNIGKAMASWGWHPRIAYTKKIPSPTPKLPSPTLTPTITPTPTKAIIPSVTPITKNIKIGVVIEDYQNRNNSLSDLQNILGVKINTISIFRQFGNTYTKDFSASDLNYAKSQNIKVQVAWEPWNPDQGMSQFEDYLSGISKGTYDAYINKFAQDTKNYGGLITLRFGHEMNGNWYPWGNRSAEYIAAYKHIHDIFVSNGVTNVTFMWCINVTENPSELAKFYPGDGYVDEIGIDGFNFGTSQSYGGWRTFTNIFGPTYNYISANYNKPIIIAETASSEAGGDKAAWIKSLFSTELPNNFPKVNELVWFNLLKEADWRINSSTSSLNAFILGINL